MDDRKELKVKKISPLSDEKKKEFPLMYPNVAAGFPSPADDFFQEKLDLNTYLIKHPAATFFVKVEGDSMIDAGIYTGDVLIVDRSLTAKENSIVIAAINGELTVKKLKKINGKLCLKPENKSYKPIELKEETDLKIWGVVTYSIHRTSC